MPTARIDFIPPAIPGLRFTQTDSVGGNVTGAVDALSVVDPLSKFARLALPVLSKEPNVPLFQFQKSGIAQIEHILRTYGGALLADDMGLGKTRQATVVASMMKTIETDVLIVCPAGVRHQWLSEVNNVDKKAAFRNLGPQSKKEYKNEWEGWDKKGGWAAVSYNMMGKALEARRPSILILDEPHNYLSGRGNKYNKELWKYLPLIRYRLACSGTPYLAKPAGLWSILYILLGMRFGRARDFDLRYCNGHQGQWGWKNDGATHMGELSDRLKFYMVRRMKTEVLKEMPAVTRTTRWVEGTKEATTALAMMDHTINGMTKAQESTLKEKFGEVVDVVSEASGPSVVFTWLKEHANELAGQLNKAKMPAIAIHGDWEAGERAKMVEQAKANKLNVVTTYGASATGLDGLQHFSSNLVFHSINSVPAITLQAIDRLNRIGQKEPITATFVAMRNSVDELVVDKVINRLDVFGQILGRDKSSVSLSDALRTSGLGVEAELSAIFDSLT